MKGPGHFIALGLLYILIGFYFVFFSDYPWFVFLFIGLAAFHFFLARVIKEWRKRGQELPRAGEMDFVKEDNNQQV